MAKAARKTVSKAKKAPPAAPTEAELEGVRAKLIEQMAAVLDDVDATVASMSHVNWSYPSPSTKLGRLRTKAIDLTNAMGRTLPDGMPKQPARIFQQALLVPNGQVPTLARPGYYLEWLAYVPVLIEWGGFIAHSLAFYAADPTEKFFSETGYRSGSLYDLDGTKGVRNLVRGRLTYEMADPKFTLHDLRGDYCENTAYRMAMNPWMVEAVARGPVDPLPLPRRFHAVQQSLFA